jgi:hypothetical protein
MSIKVGINGFGRIITLLMLMVLLAPTESAKAVEPVVSYSPPSDNPSTTDNRTDKDLLAHLGNYRPEIITNANGNEGDDTKAKLKSSVIGTKIPSSGASSSIESFFGEYFGGTDSSNNDVPLIDITPDISPFSASTFFETLSITNTYSRNNVMNIDFSHVLGLDKKGINVGLGGQLPSGLQIPMGRLQDNSLNPNSYFFTFTIRF